MGTPPRLLAWLLAAAIALTMSGCGSDLLRRLTGGPGIDDVPDFVIHTAGGDVTLPPWTWCYGNGCADGAPPEQPMAADPGDTLEFSWPEDGWEFDATFKEIGTDCPRTITVPVEGLGDHRFRLSPAGPAGRWLVDLFGRGPSGDAITTVRWRTTVAGPVPAPRGTVSVLTDTDGELDSYGVEVTIVGLDHTPREARATVSVTDAAERAVTLTPRRTRGCYQAGTAGFRAPERVGERATELGPGPYAYRVTVVLDGEEYVGTGTWPADEIEEESPATALTWSPPLPAYRP